MPDLVIRMSQRCAAPPQVVWDLVTDPRASARFQDKARVAGTAGTPGTVGFAYVLEAVGGGRRDSVRVVEAEAPRLLREKVSSDLLATSAPGQVLHPSEQLTVLEPDGDATVLHWQFITPSVRWARPYVRWSARRAARSILRGLADEAAARGR